VPLVAALIAVPLPFKTPVTVVDSVNAGVAPPELLPARPLADATETAVTVPDVPVKVPPDSVKPPATLISSAAPVDAVVLPRSLPVAIVRPFALAYALGAT